MKHFPASFSYALLVSLGASLANAQSQTWIRQLGTPFGDSVQALATDGARGVFVGGRTHASIGRPNVGVACAWFAHCEVAPPVSTFCTSGTTSNGCAPAIRGAGAPSASATSGFTIAVGGVEGQRQGVLFYGVDNGGFTPLAWGAGSSLLCVKSPVQRAAALNSGGTANLCDGALAFDWNTYRSANSMALGQPFTAGMVVYAQAWFRDPPAAKTTNLSDGLRFVLQP